MLDLAVRRCVPVAIEDTTALGAQVQQALPVGTEEAEAVAGGDDKKGLSRENNEHQLSVQQFIKNFCHRFYNRCFRIPWVAGASRLRKKIRYSGELGLEKTKRI